VTVGWRLRSELVSDDGPGARAVVDDDRLPQSPAQMLAEETARDVGRAARRERNDDTDRFRRERLGLHRGPKRSERDRDYVEANAVHGQALRNF
jgi:hypothetical protein